MLRKLWIDAATVALGFALVTVNALLAQARPPWPVLAPRVSCRPKQDPTVAGAETATVGFTGIVGACTDTEVATAAAQELQSLTAACTVHAARNVDKPVVAFTVRFSELPTCSKPLPVDAGNIFTVDVVSQKHCESTLRLKLNTEPHAKAAVGARFLLVAESNVAVM